MVKKTARLNSCKVDQYKHPEYLLVNTHLSKVGQSTKMLTKSLLSLRQLAAAHIVRAEEVENAVNDEEAVVARRKLLCKLAELFLLVFTVCGTNDEEVLIGLFWIDCDELVMVTPMHEGRLLPKRPAI